MILPLQQLANKLDFQRQPTLTNTGTLRKSQTA